MIQSLSLKNVVITSRSTRAVLGFDIVESVGPPLSRDNVFTSNNGAESLVMSLPQRGPMLRMILPHYSLFLR